MMEVSRDGNLTPLEGEVVGRVFFRLCRREGGSLGRCRGCGSLLNRSRHRCSAGLRGRGIYALYVPCADIVEPTAVIFMCVNVKADIDFLAGLDGELFDSVCTEDVENHLLRILIMCFDDILL